MTPTIRAATREDHPGVVATIVVAFLEDPLLRFAWPDPRAYLSGAHAVAGEYARAAIDAATAYVAEDFSGAAIWLPPGVVADVDVISAAFTTGAPASRLEDLGGLFAEVSPYRPEEPHWHLPMIGVEPLGRGSGVGGALMGHALERVGGEPAYLTSTNRRNVTLYERHGFSEVGRVQVGSGPVLTPMVRS